MAIDEHRREEHSTGRSFLTYSRRSFLYEKLGVLSGSLWQSIVFKARN